MGNGEPTVLGMINASLQQISTDIAEIKKELKDGAVKMENHSGRLREVECDLKELKDDQKTVKRLMFAHASDKTVHYNQGYEETTVERLKRKKLEIAAGAGSGTALATFIVYLLKALGIMG